MGAESLLEALFFNNTLTDLNLEGNRVDNDVLKTIKEYLIHNSKLPKNNFNTVSFGLASNLSSQVSIRQNTQDLYSEGEIGIISSKHEKERVEDTLKDNLLIEGFTTLKQSEKNINNALIYINNSLGEGQTPYRNVDEIAQALDSLKEENPSLAKLAFKTLYKDYQDQMLAYGQRSSNEEEASLIPPQIETPHAEVPYSVANEQESRGLQSSTEGRYPYVSRHLQRNNRRISVLSLDSSDSKGTFFQALYLEQLEEYTGKPVYELFDVMGGVGMGGILALGCAARSPHGDKPLMTPKKFRELLENTFTSKKKPKEEDFVDIIINLFDAELLLSDTLTDLFLPVIRSEKVEKLKGRKKKIYYEEETYLFNSFLAQRNRFHDFSMRDITKVILSRELVLKEEKGLKLDSLGDKLVLSKQGGTAYYAIPDSNPGSVLRKEINLYFGSQTRPFIFSLGKMSKKPDNRESSDVHEEIIANYAAGLVRHTDNFFS
ncbi:hypothetical protein [Candidatus Paracaedibacter symbiosus]|uniref:hypothetical protein n=1 Tax=Candidatus Paracaedibacter symbiosus TaxID=244582 RepID=UPI000509E5FB|nr:hypothetical protein [Candidatus Paracaedibacter symbiosus]